MAERFALMELLSLAQMLLGSFLGLVLEQMFVLQVK